MGFDIEGMRRRRHEAFEDSLEPFLAPGETVLTAAMLHRSGSTTFAGMVWDSMTYSVLRRYFSLVATDRRLLLLANEGERRPAAVLTEWPSLDVITAMDRVNFWIQIGPTRYWYMPEWQPEIDEIMRAARGD